MKKSKILMPILASAGTIAAIAPIVCLTSCGWKADIDYDCFETCKIKKDKRGQVVIEGVLKSEYKNINLNDSKIIVTTKVSVHELKFQEVVSEYLLTITLNDKDVTITLNEAFKDKYEDEKIKQIKFIVVGVTA